MNFDSVARATQGLAEYLCEWFARGVGLAVKIVIAHDTRFSLPISPAGGGCGTTVVTLVFSTVRADSGAFFAVRYCARVPAWS
jgi:hypothetical protein